MKNRLFARAAIAAALVVVCVFEAHAQSSDVIGIRAQGMGGAFTAVADDATATWWNPAGLAGGSYFNAVLEYGHLPNPTDGTVKGVAIAFPALGLSYYRLPISEMRPTGSTVGGSAIRQDHDTLSELGVTVGQSLGNHFVVGSTLKLMTAGQAHARRGRQCACAETGGPGRFCPEHWPAWRHWNRRGGS